MNYLTKIEISSRDFCKCLCFFLFISVLLLNHQFMLRFQEVTLCGLLSSFDHYFTVVELSLIKKYAVFFLYIVLFYSFMKYILKQPLGYLLSRRNRFRWMHFFLGAFLFGFFCFVILSIEITINHTYYTYNYKPIPFFKLCLISILTIPVKALFIELFFGAFLLRLAMFFSKYKLQAILITSIIFVLYKYFELPSANISFDMLMYYFFTAFYFTALIFLTDGIEVAVAAFFINNFISVIFVSHTWYDLKTEALFMSNIIEINPFLNFYLPMIVFVLFIYVVINVFKIDNWKSKLTGKII